MPSDSVPQSEPHVPRPMTAERLEELLQLSVSNQRAEGYEMTPAEIAEARTQLRVQFGIQAADGN